MPLESRQYKFIADAEVYRNTIEFLILIIKEETVTQLLFDRGEELNIVLNHFSSVRRILSQAEPYAVLEKHIQTELNKDKLVVDNL